jgi:hypothetical protein
VKLERRHGVHWSTVAVVFIDVSHYSRKNFWFLMGVNVVSPVVEGNVVLRLLLYNYSFFQNKYNSYYLVLVGA